MVLVTTACLFIAKTEKAFAEYKNKSEAESALSTAGNYKSQADGAWATTYGIMEDTNKFRMSSGNAQAELTAMAYWFMGNSNQINNDPPATKRTNCSIKLAQMQTIMDEYGRHDEAAGLWYGSASAAHGTAASRLQDGIADGNPLNTMFFDCYDYSLQNYNRTTFVCIVYRNCYPCDTYPYGEEFSNAASQYWKAKYWWEQCQPLATDFWVKGDYVWNCINEVINP